MNETLNEAFLQSLFKSALRDEIVFNSTIQHLNYKYLPDNNWKEVWLDVRGHYAKYKTIPRLSALLQMANGSKEKIAVLEDVRFAEEMERAPLLDMFADFCKKNMFVMAYNKIGESYNDGKFQQAFETFAKEANLISQFTLTGEKPERVFDGFRQRAVDRIEAKKNLEFNKTNFRIPTGIHQLDDAWGGMENGSMTLVLGSVNEGKSTCLRHIAKHAALCGYTVAHFQAEDSKRVAMNLYDAEILGRSYGDISFANFTIEEVDRTIEEVLKDATEKGGEIFVDVQGEFDKFLISECKQKLRDITYETGKQVHLIVMDFFELFHPSTGANYPKNNEGERIRRKDLGQEMKNMALEFNAAVFTATQSKDINKSEKEDPNFRKTETHLGEFKKTHEYFTYAFSLNQTPDMAEHGMMILYPFKGRFGCKWFDVPIYTKFEIGGFYDADRTIGNLYNDTQRQFFLGKIHNGK